MTPLCSEVDRHFKSGRKDILAHKTAAFRCYSGCAFSGLFANLFELATFDDSHHGFSIDARISPKVEAASLRCAGTLFAQ